MDISKQAVRLIALNEEGLFAGEALLIYSNGQDIRLKDNNDPAKTQLLVKNVSCSATNHVTRNITASCISVASYSQETCRHIF
jgi:hypothetical protein